MPLNIVEKIITDHLSPSHHNSEQEVKRGDFVFVRPRHIMTHNNSAAIIKKFESLKPDRFFDIRQPVIILDHASPAPTEGTATGQKKIRDFIHKHELPNFYDINRGICHQVMPEEGFVRPGDLILGSDSHTTTYGAFGALGIPCVRSDAAAIWATGETWLQVPQVIKIILKGRLQPGVTSKDVILHLIARLGPNYAIGKALEFQGDVVQQMSISSRMTIANMAVEMGAVGCIFPIDASTLGWFKTRHINGKLTDKQFSEILSHSKKLHSDEDADYAATITFETTPLTQQVALPHSLANAASILDVEPLKIAIQQALLGTCTNGRYEDIHLAANIVKGKQIHPRVRFIVIPASNEVYLEAMEKGDLEILIRAGATICNPNCGPCLGQHQGVLAAQECAISTSNRNFQGRMGSREATIYVANPETVAYSALAGHITHQKPYIKRETPQIKIVETPTEPKTESPRMTLPKSAPDTSTFEGALLLLPNDDIDTDGIYAGKHTYVSKTPEEMAQLAMENYDPKFVEVITRGSILATGRNFGCGSSREQAATCLMACGVQAVVAESFASTYYRNAMNNGFLLIECPSFVKALRDTYNHTDERTVVTGDVIAIDIQSGSLKWHDKVFSFPPLPPLMQDLISAGGIVQMIAIQMPKKEPSD